jgi:hypothetical protein
MKSIRGLIKSGGNPWSKSGEDIFDLPFNITVNLA